MSSVSRVLIGTTRLTPLPQVQVISHHSAACLHIGNIMTLRERQTWPIVTGRESCLLRLGLEISNVTFNYICVCVNIFNFFGKESHTILDSGKWKYKEGATVRVNTVWKDYCVYFDKLPK